MRKLFLLCLLQLGLTFGDDQLAESKFLLTAPNVLTASRNEKIFMHIFDNPQNSDFKIKLLHPYDGTELQSITLPNPAPKLHTVDLAVPSTDLHSAKIEVEYNTNQTKSAELRIRQSDTMIFVETDRPFYKPGEMVRFRILHLQNKLMPVPQPLKRVWIESASNTRMAQWKNVKTQSGLVQLGLQLSKEPVQGTWKIKVQASNISELVQKSFEVKEYVLPKFEVVVAPPTYITANANKSYTWRVCAKYSFGQPVQGNATVAFKFQKPNYHWFRSAPSSGPSNNAVDSLASKTLRKVDGCEEFELDRKMFEEFEKNYAYGIIVTAKVEERGTNVQQEASDTSQIHRESLQFDFKGAPQSLYPYMPYDGRIQLKYQNGVPASNAEVNVTVKLNNENTETQSFKTDAEGFITVSLAPMNSSLNLKSPMILAKTIDANGVAVEGTHELIPWVSPSDSYISIKLDSSRPIPCGAKTELPIFFATKAGVSNLKVFYMVQNKGEVVSKGHKTVKLNGAVDSMQAPGAFFSNNSIQTSELVMKWGHWNLELDVEPSFVPEAKLVVYYELEKREIIASSKELKFKKCLKHQVRAEFEKQQVRPGDTVTLSLDTSSDALCGISGVDRSVTFLDRDRALNLEKVFKGLEKYAAHSSISPWDYTVEDCDWGAIKHYGGARREGKSPRDKRYWMMNSRQYGNAKRAFADAAMIVLSNMEHDLKVCPEGGFKSQCETCPMLYSMQYAMPRMGVPDADIAFDNAPVAVMRTVESAAVGYAGPAGHSQMEKNEAEKVEMRSEFPETWLWQLEEISGQKKTPMEVKTPHTITDWVLNTLCISKTEGVGFAPETSLRVTKPYFMDFTLPYSVKRGETLPLKVSLFNYLEHAIPIKLRFGDFTGGNLESEATFTSCLGPRDTLVHTFKLDVKVLGDHNISVTAHLNSIDKTCGPEIIENMNDGVIKTIKVKPEGYPVEITKSLFICLTEDGEAATMSWQLPVPEDAVPDSARGEVAVIGDVMGPSMENLDGLVQLPMGCGEQNMVLFVPNIVVLNYLNVSGSAAPTLKAKALSNMAKGYQRELTYRHDDGSFSAFGKSDSSGSLWLTAFVVKSFAQAKKFIFVDDKDLDVSIKWLERRQLENGCFPQVGTVFHKEMKGGLSESTSAIKSLTAYVLIALLETKKPLQKGVLENGLFCLSKSDETPDLYSTVMTTYALQLVNERISTVMVRSAAEKHLQILVEKATNGNESEVFWQKEGGTPNMGLNIEMTAYAILSLVKAGGEENLMMALNAVKWISKQRNSRGGFVSTQDTVVALEALAKYASAIPSNQVNMLLTASTDDSDKAIEFRIDDENRQILQEHSLNHVPTYVHWAISGTGCSLLQSILRYNLKKTAEKKAAFSLSSNVTAMVPEMCSELFIEVKLSYNLENDVSNMAVLEVEMLSGYEPERSTLDELKHLPNLKIKRWDFDEGKLSLYFDSIDFGAELRFGFVASQKVLVEQVKPAQMKLYDYYEQESYAREEYGLEKLGCVWEPLPTPEAEDVSIATPQVLADAPEPTDDNDLEDRFKNFKNVDFDLEFPDGNEGPEPVYVPAPQKPFSG